MRSSLLVLALLTNTAHANPHERRLAHVAGTVVGGALYIISETVAKETLAPAECRWCEPTSVDRSIRDAVRWDNRAAANTASNVTGFAVAPVSALGLTLLASRDPAVWLDDTIPVVESAVIAGLINQAVKFGVGRQRPFVRFADPTREPDVDDNLSFYSGHTTLGFSLAVSAGVVASRRHYKLAPIIWATGLTLGATTAYLRMGADKHYFTDVAVGALAGSAVGYAVPTFLHGHVLVAPTREGVSIAGTF